jgi:isocitrate dehydrogenase (NAD+)
MSLKRSYRVTLIPGDGIGPSITESAVSVVEATGVPIEWETVQAGMAAIAAGGDPCPDELLESIRLNRIALKGPITTPIGEGFRSVNVALRKEFELFANVRPCVSYEGVKTCWPGVNIVTVRENTEGIYAGKEMYVDRERSAAVMLAVNTRPAMVRICRYAFEYATKHGHKKVTGVHKANILKMFSGVFLESFRQVSAEYPHIKAEERVIDAVCMQLVRQPQDFDVIVTTNLFGDILSDLAAGLVGGLGLAPGANYGHDLAMFEAVHGSAPDIAGKNLANPLSLVLASKMMLEHLGENTASGMIDQAVRAVLKEGKYLTPDLLPGSKYGTTDLTKALVEHIG